jgi:hypothetical protein
MKDLLIFWSYCHNIVSIVRDLAKLMECGSLLDDEGDSTEEFEIGVVELNRNEITLSLLKLSGGGVMRVSVNS